MQCKSQPAQPATQPLGAHSRSMLEGAAQALLREQSALFHRATLAFTRDPGLLCREIPGRAVEVTSAQAALGLEEALPLLATDGQFGVEFCFQVTDWRLEDLRISPAGGAATMPMSLAGGVICPRSGAAQAGSYCLVQGFCLELLLLLDTRWVGGGRCPQLEVSLSALEMADLRPELLEDDLACYVATTLEVGIVPRIRRALDCILFELGHEVSRRSAPETLPGSRRSTELVRVS